MLHNSFNYLNPSIPSVLMFAQYLANTHKNVRSVKNYLSGAKSFVRNAYGDVSPFDSCILVNLIKGVARLSAHVPSRPLSLTPTELRHCADDLASLGPGGVVARAALLFGVATFLRQSNFVAGPMGTAAHLLLRGDLRFHQTGLHVTVKSTKTIRDPRDAVVIPVAAAPGSPYCPVAAVTHAIRLAPAPQTAPVFLWPGTLRPLTGHQLITMLCTALRRRGHPAWAQATLHSLRHSGATIALGQGATIPEIMDHGTCRSRAVHSYLPRVVQSSVPHRIVNVLANGPEN